MSINLEGLFGYIQERVNFYNHQLQLNNISLPTFDPLQDYFNEREILSGSENANAALLLNKYFEYLKYIQQASQGEIGVHIRKLTNLQENASEYAAALFDKKLQDLDIPSGVAWHSPLQFQVVSRDSSSNSSFSSFRNHAPKRLDETMSEIKRQENYIVPLKDEDEDDKDNDVYDQNENDDDSESENEGDEEIEETRSQLQHPDTLQPKQQTNIQPSLVRRETDSSDDGVDTAINHEPASQQRLKPLAKPFSSWFSATRPRMTYGTSRGSQRDLGDGVMQKVLKEVRKLNSSLVKDKQEQTGQGIKKVIQEKVVAQRKHNKLVVKQKPNARTNSNKIKKVVRQRVASIKFLSPGLQKKVTSQKNVTTKPNLKSTKSTKSSSSSKNSKSQINKRLAKMLTPRLSRKKGKSGSVKTPSQKPRKTRNK